MTKARNMSQNIPYFKRSNLIQGPTKNLLELVLLPGNAHVCSKRVPPRYAGRNFWVGWGRDGWVLLDILFLKDVTVFYHPNATSSITLAIVNPEPWGLFVTEPQLVTSIEQRPAHGFRLESFLLGYTDILTYGSWPLTALAWKRPVRWENPNTPFAIVKDDESGKVF